MCANVRIVLLFISSQTPPTCCHRKPCFSLESILGKLFNITATYMHMLVDIECRSERSAPKSLKYLTPSYARSETN